MRRKAEESQNQTDLRYIRHHPTRERFPMRRLGLATALLIAVATILVVGLQSPWPI
jgi:hypothetical protein